MAKFVRHSGDADIIAYKKKASTAFENGEAVVTDANGFLVPADASATPETLIGVIKRDVTASDDDYADASDTLVEVADEATLYKAEVGAGTPAQSMVGKRYDLDANGRVNLTAQTKKVVEVVRLAQESGFVYVRFVVA